MIAAGTLVPVIASRVSAQSETTATTALSRAPQKQEGVHRVLTANILLASSAHTGKYIWADRRDLCLKVIQNQDADIICTQEVLRIQHEFLLENMPGHKAFGYEGPFMDAHPDDYHRITKNVIYYADSRYELISAGNFWLSETPLIAASKSWDAAVGRHVNWVRLKDKKTGRQFRVINTHFDHKGVQARVQQAKMIAEEAAQYADDFPQLLAGDFNVSAQKKPIKTLVDSGWINTYAAIHGPEDPGKTFHKLEGPAHNPDKKGNQIDFVFMRGKVDAKDARIIRDHKNGQYPSDHYFVSADVVI